MSTLLFLESNVGFFTMSALGGKKSMLYKVRKILFECRIPYTNPAFIFSPKKGVNLLKHKA
ncbi:hypothetical protein HNQ80_004337 [Anaerosolibacter carboniphilus]|uniref:Uncharacterized protein n=1 Tax=Anaerosolibacter carboniphilus TaxID=1417629 RepID=A0A841KXX2_9FIRM|nr:hypothetical protein [Anaerosolibacter carboniphilus]